MYFNRPGLEARVHKTIGMYINVKSCVQNVSFAVILQLTLLSRETINDCDTCDLNHRGITLLYRIASNFRWCKCSE